MESVESQSACAAPAGGFAIVETSKNSFDVAVAKSASNCKLCRGIAKLVKALDFDSSIPRFESLFPCHLIRYAPNQGYCGDTSLQECSRRQYALSGYVARSQQ